MTYDVRGLNNALHLAKAYNVEADNRSWSMFHRLLREDVRLVMESLEWVYMTAGPEDREDWDALLAIAHSTRRHYDDQRTQMRALPVVADFGIRNEQGRIVRRERCDMVEWLRRTTQSREAFVDRHGFPSQCAEMPE